MKKCPQLYNISNNFDEDIKRICSETIKKLSSYGFITFSDSNKKIIPRYLGIAVAKNSINIDTLINIMNVCKSVTN